MTSELEYLDRDCEMTVLPQPKAPGMAVVPPCTHLKLEIINLSLLRYLSLICAQTHECAFAHTYAHVHA